MNPDLILKADVLDIIFENRNKDYGAYELRTRYNKRLKKAMTIMFSIVAVCCSLIYVDNRFFHDKIRQQFFSSFIDSVDLSKLPPTKKVEVIKPKTANIPHQDIATIRSTTPLIVQQIKPIDPTPTVDDIIKSQIGSQTKAGELPGDNVSITAHGNDNDNDNSKETKTESAEPIIFESPEYMPEFPGGEEALKRFLSKNIRAPKEDIDPGKKIRVLEKFVVDEQGNISNIQIIQSGGADFDNEVMRVLKKMPKWKPGKQNGRNVAVYFTIPVIFQSQDEN